VTAESLADIVAANAAERERSVLEPAPEDSDSWRRFLRNAGFVRLGALLFGPLTNRGSGAERAA
jgi:hypothetical protein